MPSLRLALGFEFNLVIATAGGDRATWAVGGFLDREAMDLHLKGQLDRTITLQGSLRALAGRLEPAERLSRSACNRNCANGKPCRFRMFSRRVHSTNASIGLGGSASLSGKR
ncbi:hypothetical protein L210DRAFT_3551162, partial [Boletus edulis BED1]